MGGGTGGGYSSQSSTLSSNIKDLGTKYPLNSEGKFGKPGSGKNTQQVSSKDPLATGNEFLKNSVPAGKLRIWEMVRAKLRPFPINQPSYIDQYQHPTGAQLCQSLLRDLQGLITRSIL